MPELHRWDERYQKGDTPWETGLPSSEIQRVLAEGAIQPCRAVELGCGTGASAVWLSQQGFDVTALDLSAAAIDRARQRAKDARERVNFLVADGSALSDSCEGPFLVGVSPN